jgi:hypothetical protein
MRGRARCALPAISYLTVKHPVFQTVERRDFFAATIVMKYAIIVYKFNNIH